MTQSSSDCLRDETALRLEAGAKVADVQVAWAYRPTGDRQSENVPGPVLG